MPEYLEIPDPNVFRAYGTYFLKTKHKFVQRLMKYRKPNIHGHRTWQTSFVLMDYLEHNPLDRGENVIDIGCGWAPVGVYCANRFGAHVTALDADKSVFPFVQLLEALNDVQLKKLHLKFEKLTKKRLSEQRLVVGSDICFWDELVAPMYNLIRRALRVGVKRIVIADPGRQPFYTLAQRCEQSLDAELVRWYAVEPTRHNGDILEIRNSVA